MSDVFRFELTEKSSGDAQMVVMVKGDPDKLAVALGVAMQKPDAGALRHIIEKAMFVFLDDEDAYKRREESIRLKTERTKPN